MSAFIPTTIYPKAKPMWISPNSALGPDRADVIPVLKQILAINPAIKILGSPWSAPAWMKTNDRVKGGHLKPEYYGVYAAYFVKYIEQMKAEGIPIAAVTVQNEPLNPKNTPSMVMFAEEEDTFIARHLGPAFQNAGITDQDPLVRPQSRCSILCAVDPCRPGGQ